MQAFSKLSEGLWVENQGINMVKQLAQDKKTRIILFPVYKSYADPLILHFINYLKDFELGFTFGNYEDSP